MRVKITTELLRKLPLADVDIYDTKYPGLVLRCRPSGGHTYRVRYGRGQWVTLGRADTLTIEEARGKARDELSAIAKGKDPKVARQQRALASLTFQGFLDDHYAAWKTAEHKRGDETVQRLRSVFADFLPLKLSDLTQWRMEKWRTARLKQTPRPKPATVNSHLTMLKAALEKAVEWKHKTGLAAHPLTTVKPLQADRTGRVRFLSPDEEQRLRQALAARDVVLAAQRAQANAWRRARGYAEYPTDAADHLTTIVLIALNTGLRKGEIFHLKWSDIVGPQVTVRGEGAKSAQTRYVPLNVEAVALFTAWRQQHAQAKADAYVFPGRVAGEQLDDVKKAWAPVVTAARFDTRFTFHDLRHTFASNLVMQGVDLNTVRELLGHSTIKMVLRYAHLSPEHKAAAVAKLVQTR